MLRLTPTTLAPPEPCPYLPGRQMRLEFFYAERVEAEEFDELLATGWRKFGRFYFRPKCPSCRECVPLRVLVDGVRMTRSQRKIWKRNRETAVTVRPMAYHDDVYRVYKDHSEHKFGKQTTLEEFLVGFYGTSCPSLQSEYRVDGELAAVGFLDHGVESLSSVYFVYAERFSRLGLGVCSVMAEAAHARETGLKYYYMGYCISDNQSMSYKGRFERHERYDWESGEWREGGSLGG